ncbi:condensin-2 complex subunit G2 [Senna tora]|uniref:Condensin-2 complex subunit G2 n=1 Tax=Senna tora TaxID=362788 RepID=A0A834WMP4_9FABA|nr:condensin-2 complex subunit G2 [Senna tora]
MDKRLRSSLQSSAQDFLSSATTLSLKSSRSSLKTLIHGIKSSSDLCSSLPPSLCDSILSSVQSFRNLLEPNLSNLSPTKSPRSPPTKRLRRSSRHSKTPTATEPVRESHGSNLEHEKQKVLQRLEILAHIALLCVSHPQNVFSPSDLLPGVQALHDNLIIFESASVLSSGIECLCEEWWKEKLPGRELLISQFLPFLLSRSLTLKKKVDVHRVCVHREAFVLFDFDDESIEDLKLLLLRCVISPLYLKTEDGRRFLIFIFGLSNQLAKEILSMIRSQIPFGRKSMLEAYGDILFRAWKAMDGDSKVEIENRFLQYLIESAIHASSGIFASHIRRVIGAFINQRTTNGVEKLLFRLAEPVIFRSLQVANSNVRQNALHLLLDMFPLEDPDATKEEKDTLLGKQFFLLERLLTDDCPEVRKIAVEGSCRILHLYWEIIPSPTITKILTKIFDDISHDICSEVRLSLLKGIVYLLGNPQSHEILKVLLPRLRHLMLDNVLTVRVAAADLLLHLKDIRNFQFHKVVDLDVLLSVLASDQPPVAQKITKLLIPSYFPLNVSLEEACNRCMTLVKRSPIAGARFCKFAISERPSKQYLLELVKILLNLVLSPNKLDAHQIEGFLVASSYICDYLASESYYRNAIKELIAAEKGKSLLALASTSQAHSSLFNIVSTISPDDAAELLEECMGIVTNCSGLPEDVDCEDELRSAHKLLLSSGGFDDMFETLSALLHKTAYRCHIKFGTDMPPTSGSAKRKISKSSRKSSTKLKVINRKQSFEADYSVAVGVAWQIRDMLLHEDMKKAVLRSPSLEMSFLALKVISEFGRLSSAASNCLLLFTNYHVIMLQENLPVLKLSGFLNCQYHTVLELTMDHILNCLEKLFGADNSIINGKKDSDNLRPTKRKAQNPTGKSSSSCKDASMFKVLKNLIRLIESYFIYITRSLCWIHWYYPDELLNYTSGCIQHIICLIEQLNHNQILFKEEDLKDTILCLKSSFTYAAKILNLILRYCTESSTTLSKAFDLANDLLDLIILIESYLGSGYAFRLVAAVKPWLPDLVLALGSETILKRSQGKGTSSASFDHFPKWPLILAKSELYGVNGVRNEEDDKCSQPEKFSAFNRLLAMLIILLKGNAYVMDAVGVAFLTCSLVGLERKDFELALGFLHFVCVKLFKQDDRDWGDLMLSSLQEIYPKIEKEIAEQIHEDELEKLHSAKKLLEPLWMYHLYETGRVSMTEA